MRRLGSVVAVAAVLGVSAAAVVDALRGPAREASRTVASGRAFGTEWRLSVSGRCAVFTFGGRTTRSCGHDGGSVQVVRTGGRRGETVLFGPLPKGAERVWLTLIDRRVVVGTAFAVAGAPFDVYVLPVGELRPGTVIAVDGRRRLLDRNWVFTSSEPGRPMGVVDAFGNVIGYTPVGDWALPPPGRAARLEYIRLYLIAPLTDLLPELEGWWADRPARGAAARAVEAWWRAYPVARMLTPPAAARAGSRA